ncbi:hypothetical protein K438DRAFT_1834708 [Mycena galopus ATCC 62051]|nr:hypothetical protein K438DRAFT_1834708 [Mycena galopus ATCC 62051]
MSLPATFLEFLPVFRVLSAASFVRSMPLYNVPISVRNFLSRPWHYSSCPFPRPFLHKTPPPSPLILHSTPSPSFHPSSSTLIRVYCQRHSYDVLFFV